ncbi:MAG: carbohydrate ABC transporter substrate-binding protein, partial [Spirochaetes bacterium]|nr:carbohydrate ABC transporter substrate-binding protein [Spirochaetota bacterium]
AGNPPDIAGLPGPGKMKELAKESRLIDLNNVLNMDQIKKDYAAGWLDMATVDGKLVGVFIKAALKGLVWYRPENLEAEKIKVPVTWDQMIDICEFLINNNDTPWAIGIESGAASGWVGTDWLENIFLRMYGPQMYKDWYEGKIPWTSNEVKSVWEKWGEIVANPKMIYGGRQYVLSTNFGQAYESLFTDPPNAYFHHQASFIQSFIKDQYPDLKPGKDFLFFEFPVINNKYKNAIEAGGDIFGMFNDTPQAKAFIQYISTVEAQSYWVKEAGALSPNRSVQIGIYPDELSKAQARIMKKAEIVVFDASDMMSGQMNNAFWSAVVKFVENPADIDNILSELEKVRKEAY